MKRLMVMGLTALGLVLTFQQPASAWSRFKFGIGFNISWEGANNCFLFGLLKGGPAPGQVVDAAHPAPPPGYGDPNMPPGGMSPYSPGMVPDNFMVPPPVQQPMPAPGPAPMPLHAPQPSSAQPVAYYPNQPPAMVPYQSGGSAQDWNAYYGGGAYQSVAQNNYGYGAGFNQNFQAPSYWYPGAAQAPSYWYGR